MKSEKVECIICGSKMKKKRNQEGKPYLYCEECDWFIDSNGCGADRTILYPTNELLEAKKMSEDKKRPLTELVDERKYIDHKMATLREERKEIDNEIMEHFNVESLYNEKGKDYGEMSVPFEYVSANGHVLAGKVRIRRDKRVKYDEQRMMEAARKLDWNDVQSFFKVKFDMPETGYKKLADYAEANPDTYNEVLDDVNEARTVTVSEAKISDIDIEDIE